MNGSMGRANRNVLFQKHLLEIPMQSWWFAAKKPANKQFVMDKFKAKLYAEFERNCFHIFGVPGARVREVLSDREDDLFQMYQEAWEYGGAVYMRQTMAFTILSLEAVYHETEIGRELTEEERNQRFESFDIGMDGHTIDAWQTTRVAQLDGQRYSGAHKKIRQQKSPHQT